MGQAVLPVAKQDPVSISRLYPVKPQRPVRFATPMTTAPPKVTGQLVRPRAGNRSTDLQQYF